MFKSVRFKTFAIPLSLEISTLCVVNTTTMAEGAETVKLSLRLLIDEERNKVVLAETGKDFVDVLFSFLTLPMGTIVRLLEKHRTSPQVVVGCFNNLYKSVSEMGLESFQTESCKQVLLYPRSVYRDKYRKIKLKIDDTEAVKYFVCPRFHHGGGYCRRYYSLLSTESCGCGEIVDSKLVSGLMNQEIQELDEEQVQGNSDDIFVSYENSFVITDDLKVALSSMDYVLNTLKGLGYANAHKLGEIVLDVGLSEIFTLLECLFTSDSPLTDTFLRKQSSLCLTRSRIPLTPTVQESGAGPEQTITLKAFVRKVDGKFLCVESGADFIDLVFTFLALPLGSVWDISGDNITLGCIGNVFRSFKGLNEENDDSSSSAKCLLPSYYSCPKQLLDVVTLQTEIYYYRFCPSPADPFGGCSRLGFTRKMPDCFNSQSQNIKVFDMTSFGFVRGYVRYLVTDDLVIKLKDSVSNISLLKLTMHLAEEDVREQMITIGKSEAISLLRTSMITSSALTTCFWNLIVKKAKEET
ncbi:PREDICTED: uncharacterized protein LOC104745077 [Camelina sativa]|uniref:Uncharacterized protein LOC104745077 n=1 Tax=Camelina sativa TaxID=90675 RepID=A0ABM0W1Y8_CAMSA|nr:PREDICTED: uncharacterized protein LOC104745077 [Camelina sativa]